MWVVAASFRRTHSPSRLGLKVGAHLALNLHSSSQLGELSQWVEVV